MSRTYYPSLGESTLPPPPTRSEEVRLFTDFRAKRTAARRDHIVRCYLKFALRLARRDMKGRPEHMRSRAGLSEDDAISAANLGLVTAIERFDPKLGYRFTTYAGFWIYKYLMEARYGAHLVAISDAEKRAFTRLCKLRRKLGMTDEEMAEETGMSEAEIDRVMQLPFGRTCSLPPMQDGEEPALLDDTAPEAALVDEQDPASVAMHDELLRKLPFVLESLPHLTRDVLRDRFYKKLRTPEIAKRRGLSLSAVDRILADGLKSLRTQLET